MVWATCLQPIFFDRRYDVLVGEPVTAFESEARAASISWLKSLHLTSDGYSYFL